MKRKTKIAILVILLFLFFGAVIVSDKFRPAGCFHFSHIFTGGGGCNDNTKVFAFKTEPKTDCLNIKPSSCSSPSRLSVQNLCGEPVYIDGVRVDTKQSYSSNYTWGEFVLEQVNASLYKRFTLNGTVGNRTFTISYVKTRPLC